jgi:nucleoside-diphosphate-sugar epimerase
MPPVASLVTGVGYIGGQLALDLLDRGEEVVGLENGFSTSPALLHALSHPGLTLLRGSAAEPRAIKAALDLARPRVVYHLAAQPSADSSAASAQLTEHANLVGPRVLLQALKSRGVERVVLASSFKVLGDTLPRLVRDTQPYGRVGDLAHLSKIYLEKLAEMFAWRGGPRAVAVRLGITYGLGPLMKHDPRFQTVPNRFCAQAAAGEPLRVLASRPAGFVHVRDAARALLAAADLRMEGPYCAVNCAPEVLAVGEVARLVQKLGAERGLCVRIERDEPRQGVPFSVKSALDSAGFTARETLAASLHEVLDHFLAGERAPGAP